MSKEEIIPAILTDSSLKFKELVRKLEPYIHRIHIDIADGDFVPNKTVNGYQEIKELDSQVRYDIHLMVKLPELVMKEWLYTHADRFIVHIEAVADFEKLINELHINERKAGLAINPETPIESLEPFLAQVDFVQFMTVHPGFQGAKFETSVVDKIAAFHSKYPDIMIMSDGGITPETAPALASAGVSELVSGSYVVKSNNFEEAIKQLEDSVKN